jgi:hypothetical protein
MRLNNCKEIRREYTKYGMKAIKLKDFNFLKQTCSKKKYLHTVLLSLKNNSTRAELHHCGDFLYWLHIAADFSEKRFFMAE